MTGEGGDLSIRSVSKRFGEVVALDGVNFEVAAGEIFGFVGSNGAGKSTTMRIVLGVLAADSGEVRIGDKTVDLQTRRQIGYMPEERGLYPKMKVGEQLSYLAQLHGRSRAAAGEAVRRWTSRLDIDKYLDVTVDTLSLGNQQRVQLAAALVHDPAVLVLDEPFSGLDPVAVDVMSDVLRQKADGGVPVLFSSHQLELVQRVCDRVGIIQAGRMCAVGTVAELRRGDYDLLEVVAPAAPKGWADALPGVRAVRSEDPMTVLELERGADDQRILRAALEFGPVHHFAMRQPSLAELFREVVAV
jgi:ABC-2 type transport system ATP-binding protein